MPSCRGADDLGKLGFAPGAAGRRANAACPGFRARRSSNWSLTRPVRLFAPGPGSAVMGSPGRRRLKIFFDGGCRPNPGRIEVAVVARGVSYYFDDLGYGTSSDSEWLALRLALRIGQSLGERDFDLIGDCADVIAQANGSSRCRTEAAAEHRARFQE